MVTLFFFFLTVKTWYCSVSLGSEPFSGVAMKTMDLEFARDNLLQALENRERAIMQMDYTTADDPNNMVTQWDDGKMYWDDWADINAMQDLCNAQSPPALLKMDNWFCAVSEATGVLAKTTDLLEARAALDGVGGNRAICGMTHTTAGDPAVLNKAWTDPVVGEMYWSYYQNIFDMMDICELVEPPG